MNSFRSSWVWTIFVFISVFIILNINLTEGRIPAEKAEVLLRIKMRGRAGMYDNPEDYEYEIIHGHPKHDGDKMKRQAGCMCFEHFYDPHCGSDKKIYDNGCFFMCAQKRNPDLKLFRWGVCEAKDDSGSDNRPRSQMVELDFDFDSMDD